jgi:hypothetical protein
MTTLKITTRTLAAGFALAAGTLAAQAAPLLQFDTALKSVNVGDSFVLLLQGSGFDMTAGGLLIDNLSGGQKLNLAFTPGALEVLSVDIDPRWSFAAANKTGVADNAGGTLTGMAFGTFPATPDDSFNIARISFRALAAAPADVVVTAVDFAGKVNGVGGSKFAASYVATAVQISSAVPEPQSWALLVAGLGLLALRVRRA